MNIPTTLPDTAEEGRDQAIQWQHWMSEQNLSLDEMADWSDYFVEVAWEFPELFDEFIENAII